MFALYNLSIYQLILYFSYTYGLTSDPLLDMVAAAPSLHFLSSVAVFEGGDDGDFCDPALAAGKPARRLAESHYIASRQFSAVHKTDLL
jgi:hypothetical protein